MKWLSLVCIGFTLLGSGWVVESYADEPERASPSHEMKEGKAFRQQLKQRRAEIKAEIDALPPEERKQRAEHYREQFRDEACARIEARFKGRWDKASEREREKVCSRTHKRCSTLDEDAPEVRQIFCDVAREHCGKVK